VGFSRWLNSDWLLLLKCGLNEKGKLSFNRGFCFYWSALVTTKASFRTCFKGMPKWRNLYWYAMRKLIKSKMPIQCWLVGPCDRWFGASWRGNCPCGKAIVNLVLFDCSFRIVGGMLEGWSERPSGKRIVPSRSLAWLGACKTFGCGKFSPSLIRGFSEAFWWERACLSWLPNRLYKKLLCRKAPGAGKLLWRRVRIGSIGSLYRTVLSFPPSKFLLVC
jgi:hypothetical protein